MHCLKLSRLSLACALSFSGTVCFAVDAPDSSTCQAPAAPEPTSVVETTDYTKQTAEVADWNVEAARKKQLDYDARVRSNLLASSDPRDWALFAVFTAFAPDANHVAALRMDRLRRAVVWSPNDLVIQIIALSQSWAKDNLKTQALENLKRMEPENGAWWAWDIQSKPTFETQTQTDATVAHIAMSREFDNHFVLISSAAEDVYRRYPIPDDALEDSVTDIPSEARPIIQSIAAAAAIAFPAYQHLMTACRAGTIPEKSATRIEDCENAGRLMQNRGTDLLARRVGSALLRVSRTFNDEDQKTARVDDWVVAQFQNLEAEPMTKDAASMFVAHEKDWVDSGDEVEAMRRTIQRAGISTIPPDDWVDTRSSFSQERIEQDKLRLKDEAKTN